MTDIELTELLYSTGTMPNRYYYQLNGKSAMENYKDYKSKTENLEKELEIYKERRKAEIEAELEKETAEELPQVVNAALDDLFKEWL